MTLNIQDTKQTRSFKEPYTISKFVMFWKFFNRAVGDNGAVNVTGKSRDVVAAECRLFADMLTLQRR